jgi:hypothetical protein
MFTGTLIADLLTVVENAENKSRESAPQKPDLASRTIDSKIEYFRKDSQPE